MGIQRLIVAQRRNYRVLEIPAFLAGSGLQTNLRQQRTLVLPQFCFRGPPVGGRFTDARIGRNRLVDGVEDGESLACSTRDTSGTSQNHNRDEYGYEKTHDNLQSPSFLTKKLAAKGI